MSHEADLKFEAASAPAPADPGARNIVVPFMLSGEPRKAAKSEPVPVWPDMIVAEAVEAIVTNCLQHFRTNEPAVVTQRDAAALHQVRVSMRRLRAALSLFRPALADAQFQNIRHELRWFSRQLGDARNLDVFLQSKGLPKRLRAVLGAGRNAAYDEVIEALHSKRLRLLLIDLAAWIELGRWRQNPKASRPLPEYAARRLYKWWQRIARHRDIEAMRPDERHRLRIEVKKFRYALEFVQPLHTGAGRSQNRFSKSVERLQESLGKLNDAVTARALWRKFGGKLPRSKRQEHEIEDKCLHSAQASLDRLKKIGPYWTRLA